MSTIVSSTDKQRVFIITRDDKSTVRCRVRKADRSELDGSDIEYSREFNRNLLAGLPTQQAMLRKLRDNGVIDPKTEEEVGTLTGEFRALSKKARGDKAVTADKERLAVVEGRLSVLQGEINSFFAHTCDNKAAQAQRNFLLACTAEYAESLPGHKEGDRVWEEIDHFVEEPDGSFANRIVYEFVRFGSGDESEWDKLMEAQEAARKAREDAERATGTPPDVTPQEPAPAPVNQAVVDAAAAATPAVPPAVVDLSITA